MLQRFRGYCVAKPLTPSGFILIRGPRRQVFVCGVEVKSTLHRGKNGYNNRGTALLRKS